MSTLSWATITALVFTAGSAAAEEIVIEDSVFGYAATGTVYTLAEDHVFWVGEFSGSIQSPGAGEFEVMAAQCPGWNEFDSAANVQRAGGFCTNILPSGDSFVFRWSCEGTVSPETCSGPLEVIRGTGSLEGITGTSTMANATTTVTFANGTGVAYTPLTWNLVTP